jgi:hypothetical protein
MRLADGRRDGAPSRRGSNEVSGSGGTSVMMARCYYS